MEVVRLTGGSCTWVVFYKEVMEQAIEPLMYHKLKIMLLFRF